MNFNEIKSVLKNKTVGIAGCGGLGSNCAIALARIGVGTLIIVDFDIVTESNLNRQYFFTDQIGKKKSLMLRSNIEKVNPTVRVVAYDLKLSPDNIPDIFGDCDVMVEAFDLAEEKQMLVETVTEKLSDIPLVLGLGMAGIGKNETIHYRKAGNLHVCGDEVSEISAESPPLAPRVGIVANMQANVVSEILLGRGEK